MSERASARDAPSDRPLLAVLVLTGIAALALCARELNNARVVELPGELPGDPAAGWFSADPDGLYHARRLERALDEGRVAADDPLLNHPHGAAVPWPPYYTQALRALLGPFVPPHSPADAQGGKGASDARHAWIERAVATVPAVLACLTACALALAAWRFGGAAAGTVAGATFALLGASLDYSVPGIGDHHAWATLLAALVFALTAACFQSPARTVKSAAWLGGLAGAAAGLLVGSWVGGLVHVALVQVALGWLILVNARRAVAGLAPFGLAFHLALGATLLPAVAASPWRHEQPWMVINLSWFHVALPLIGALVFAPLVWLTPGTLSARAYPWIGAAAFAIAGLALGTSDAALARGLREGFAWAGRDNAFMAYITESQPLLWGQIGGIEALHQKLGYAAWLVVPAWFYAARRALGGEHGLVVWAVALPPMLAQALVQRRFAEVLGVPLAVVLGIAAGALCVEASRSLRTRPALAAAVGLVLGALGQWPVVRHTIARTRAGQHVAVGPALDDQRSTRALLHWIQDSTPAGSAVLAAWDLGHAIEWVAGRASVATNFGSYVGEAGYLAPWRFFLEEDPAAAEALLAERGARHVLILGSFSKDLEVMLRLVRPLERGEFVDVSGAGPRPTARWYRTMAARLMLTGKVGDPASGSLGGDSLGFLRLVHVAPEPLRSPMPIPHMSGAVPAGWVWEHVPGATVTAHAASGERLEVLFDVEYPEAARRLLWSAGATAGADGIARVRVPYATDALNGGGRVIQPRWKLGGRSGALAIPEQAVLEGGEVQVP
jgi:asparagine N-glycosylation enzyme membrane subunit Stt3